MSRAVPSHALAGRRGAPRPVPLLSLHRLLGIRATRARSCCSRAPADWLLPRIAASRTLLSKLIVIKLLQEWKATSFMTPNFHDWNRFMKPEKLHALMQRHGIANRETRWLSMSGNPLQIIRILRQLKRGAVTFGEIGDRLYARVSDDLSVEYIGYGVKQT